MEDKLINKVIIKVGKNIKIIYTFFPNIDEIEVSFTIAREIIDKTKEPPESLEEEMERDDDERLEILKTYKLYELGEFKTEEEALKEIIKDLGLLLQKII